MHINLKHLNTINTSYNYRTLKFADNTNDGLIKDWELHNIITSTQAQYLFCFVYGTYLHMLP